MDHSQSASGGGHQGHSASRRQSLSASNHSNNYQGSSVSQISSEPGSVEDGDKPSIPTPGRPMECVKHVEDGMPSNPEADQQKQDIKTLQQKSIQIPEDEPKPELRIEYPVRPSGCLLPLKPQELPNSVESKRYERPEPSGDGRLKRIEGSEAVPYWQQQQTGQDSEPKLRPSFAQKKPMGSPAEGQRSPSAVGPQEEQEIELDITKEEPRAPKLPEEAVLQLKQKATPKGEPCLQKIIDEVKKKEDKWTQEQDQRLIALVSLHHVEKMATVRKTLNTFIQEQRASLSPEQAALPMFMLKTEVECMDRWLLLRNNTEDGTVKQIKGNWTPEEDMILRKKVAEYGLKKWKEIATFLPGRIGKQCRERWYNNVDPNLNKEKWTVAEDLQLMELHTKYGNKWVKIQQFMPGRIDNDIKNRFNASLRKYKTFDEYLLANDKKREKSKKKYYWRQHYELRNVNNSKRLPMNDQDKEFKDMAQQKIQMEVGRNLPPLKNDLILEKKKEHEEYQKFKQLKAQLREHKKACQQKDKRRNKGSNVSSPDKDFDTLSAENKIRVCTEQMARLQRKFEAKAQGKKSEVLSEHCPDMEDSHQIPADSHLDDTHPPDFTEDYEAGEPSEPRNRTLASLSNLAADPAYKRMFDVKTITSVEQAVRQAEATDAFQKFQTKQFRELHMPSRAGEEVREPILQIFKQEKVMSSHVSALIARQKEEETAPKTLEGLTLSLAKTEGQKLLLNEKLKQQRANLLCLIQAELSRVAERPKQPVQPKAFPFKLLGKRPQFPGRGSSLFQRLAGGKKQE